MWCFSCRDIVSNNASKFLNIQRENMELKKDFFNESHSPPFSKKGLSETKIVSRFWIVSILLAILTLITLKLR